MAHHVIHMGIDGLRPDCIELAPGGAPNMLTRLVRQVRMYGKTYWTCEQDDDSRGPSRFDFSKLAQLPYQKRKTGVRYLAFFDPMST